MALAFFQHASTEWMKRRKRMNDKPGKMAKNAVHEMYPYICVKDCGAAIEFYKRAFGAEELFRLTEPSGRIGHAELKMGPATLIHAPQGGAQGMRIHLHVDDVDALTERACGAGATLLMKPTDQFYGERSSRVRDPYGHEWLLGNSIEEMSPAEMQRRYTDLMKG
jgi:uncharacterized glyoxalase superfamily protein PhnB